MLAGAFLSQIADAQIPIYIASDDWCPFICAKDGKITGGFLVDASIEAMQSGGYQVEPVLMPLSRAIHETTLNHIQGVYAPPIDQRFDLSVPIGYSRACFYTRTDSIWTYRGLDSLHDVVVGIVSEYGYDENGMDAYIVQHQHEAASFDLAYGEHAGAGNLKKLLAARFPVMLEHESVMALLIRQTDAKHIRQAGCLDHPLSLPVGFTRMDPHNVAWKLALAKGMRQLEANGKLAELKRHYQIVDTTTDKNR